MATTLINNRLILFRGFGAGMWRYGQYLHLDITPKCEYFNKNFRDFIFNQSSYGENFFPVDGTTVGQFTGYCDSFKKPIYEGDLVKVAKPYNGIYQVKYINSIGAFGLQEQDEKRMFLELGKINYRDMEIIGNIYELTKNKHDGK